MAVVNKFNVNKQQVTLDADIIENMSANDVSYNDSFQYDENTVGNKISELDSKVDDIVNGKRIEPTSIEENKLVYVNSEERTLIGFKLYRFVAPENGKYNIKTFINSAACVVIGENPSYIIIGKGSSGEFAEFEMSVELSAKENIAVSVYGDYIPTFILQSINSEVLNTFTIKPSSIVYGKYIHNGEYKSNSACRIFYYDVVAGNTYFVEAKCFGVANIDENDAITKFEPLSTITQTKTRFTSQTNKIAISINTVESPIIASISDSNVDYFVDGINEAPKDENIYGRKNGDWYKIEGGGSTTKVFEHGLLEESGITRGILYYYDNGKLSSMDLKRYSGYHAAVSGNTEYVVYSCSFNIVQKIANGTYIGTQISTLDNEEMGYVFTTNTNAVELYWSSLSTINDIARTEDELCIKDQGEESVCVEKRNSQTPQLYINNIVVSGNKKIVEKGVLLDLYKYPLLPCWGHEYLSCYYNKLINGDDVKITFDGDSITAQGYRRDAIKSIFEAANYSGNVTLNNLGYGSRSSQEWAGTGQYYNPGTKEQDLTNLPNGIIHKSMETNPDLLICGMGVNDAVVGYDGVDAADKTTIEERLQLFESAYREVLQRVRGTESVNGRPAYGKDAEHLAIILCTPTHSCGVPKKVTICRDDDNWHIYVRKIIQRLCREYKCAFCDFSLTTFDLAFSPNNVWGDNMGLHPTKAFTFAYAQYLQQLVLPLPFWKNNKLS